MQGIQDVYDIKSASSRIEQIANERSQFRRAGIQLAELTKRPDWSTSYSIYQSNTGSGTQHIVHAKNDIELSDPAEIEEVVISLQGVLWKQDLPPFSEKIMMRSPNRIRFLRQSVTLTGFGTPIFEHGIKSLMEVHALFGRHLPENKLGECTAIDKCNNKFLGIHLSNRYFTTLHDAPDEPHISFAEGIDPYGYLADLVATGPYFHSEQNVVKYNNRYIDSKGTIKYEEILPVRFRVGDIVEAKATLMVIPLKGGQFKLIAVLRSLTLWDTQFTQIAQLAMHSRIKKLMVPSSSLKRNIAYDEDNVEAEVEQKKHENTETSRRDVQEADVIMHENERDV